MPAYVNEVKYGKFGQATASLTLFGGMDQSLYNDFKKESGRTDQWYGKQPQDTPLGHYGPGHMASSGKIVQVTKQEGNVPLGSSGIQIDFKTDQIIEAIRPGKGCPHSTSKLAQVHKSPGRNISSIIPRSSVSPPRISFRSTRPSKIKRIIIGNDAN